jgi:hypothetical protein
MVSIIAKKENRTMIFSLSGTVCLKTTKIDNKGLN